MSQVAKHFHKPWKLMVSVCLTRMNLISRELNDIENRYATLQEQTELKQSVYNNYEYKKLSLQEIEKKKSHNLSHDEEATVMEASRELAAMQDQEDVWTSITQKVSLSNRTTEADKAEDTKSLQRRLDDILHFVVKDGELMNQQTSLYPYDVVMPQENLKTASERILQSHGINSSNMIFFSNAPVGVVKIRFKENEERGQQYQGAKVFFTKAQLKHSPTLLKEEIIEAPSAKSFEWLTLNELQENTDSEYYKRIKTFLQ